MKKTYMVPGMTMVKLQHQGLLMQQSVLHGMSSNLSGDDAINYGGGGNGSARTKESSSIWDDEW